MVLAPAKGWIGLELGPRSVVIAQVQRSAGVLRIVAGCEMPRACADPETSPGPAGSSGVSAQELAAARLLAPGLKGTAAACALSLSVTDLSHATLPPGRPHEQYAILANEFESAGAGSARRFDFWPSALTAGEPSTGLVDVNVISIDETEASAVARSLRAAGLDCRVLDSLPHAVARAVAMAKPGHGGRPLAGLHLGYDSALFVVSRDGAPVFVRQLRDAGTHRIVERVARTLGLAAEDAVGVLRDPGLPASPAEAAPRQETQDVLAEITAEPLDETAEELRRTLSYLDAARIDAAAEGVCLLGEGAGIGNFGPSLGARAGLGTWNWGLPRGPGHGAAAPPSAPLLAVASALSALAWES
ncbi:MAG: hypothetical protein ACYC6Y_18680 [Thermoguttaceae bacterium]